MERKVIHLIKDGQDYYFGSLAALCSHFGKDEIGVSYGGIRNYGITPEHPYQNKYVTIKEGVLITKKGERGNPDVKKAKRTKKKEPPKGTPLF